MGYGDLLRALSDEAEREARRVREDGAREAERVLEESRRAAAEERERALAAARAGEEAALGRARAEAAHRAESAALAEARRQLEEVRRAALEAVRGRAVALTPALTDELAALAAPGPMTFVVDPGEEQAVRAHLERAHPELAARAAVRAAPAPRGGVELEQEGIVLDDTVAARLDRAWPALEPRLAALLLGSGDDRL